MFCCYTHAHSDKNMYDGFIQYPTLWENYGTCIFFSCDQAALRIRLSVCLSVRPSVTPFSQCSCHRIIIFRSYYHWQKWCPCKRSRSEIKCQGHTEVKTQLSRCRIITPVWIHIWWWNDAKSFMLLRGGALWIFKVIRQISRSHS